MSISPLMFNIIAFCCCRISKYNTVKALSASWRAVTDVDLPVDLLALVIHVVTNVVSRLRSGLSG